MKSHSCLRLGFSASLAAFLGLAGHTACGQALYSVTKSQVFSQTSAAGVVADPPASFVFSVQAAANVTFTLPAGGAVAVPFSPIDNNYALERYFNSKGELDAAFPAGTYRMTGTGISALAFNLATDLYPLVTPQVTGGTWNSGGLLVVNPAQSTTITFSTFAGYATSGVAGHMQVKVQGLSDNVRIRNEILSVANSFGITVQSTPLTSITIPAGTLTSGRAYQGEVSFDTLSTLDTASVPNGAAIGIFNKKLRFYIAAQDAGTTTPPAVFVSQPPSLTGVLGGTVTFGFGVTIGGSNQIGNIFTQWSFNGQPINVDGVKYANSTTSPGLVVKNLTAADAGVYTLTLVNAGGVVTSTPATLTLAAAAPPTLARQPSSQTVAQGSTVVFSIEATGTPTPSFQWQLNGVNLQGQTSPLLVLQNAGLAQAGSYTVVVANGIGTPVTSRAASLSVTTTNDPGRLINLSVLTDVSAATPSFTVATVVGGAGTSGPKPLVVRVVGPSLAAITGSSAGLLPAPKLDLFLGQTAIASNTTWGGGATLTTAMASVGAFAFTGPTSLDSAIYQPSLTPGNYSVIASGVGGATGLCIAEIYDATPAGTFTPSTPRLINVSVLKQISAGGSVTLGFVVGGSTAKTVLIRAIGPGLAAILGSTAGTLGDPQLTLFNSSSQVIATNDDWGADPQLSSAGSRVGAFFIGNAASKDAMLITTLPPGLYSARASGNGGTSGLAIVEVYEVP